MVEGLSSRTMAKVVCFIGRKTRDNQSPLCGFTFLTLVVAVAATSFSLVVGVMNGFRNDAGPLGV